MPAAGLEWLVTLEPKRLVSSPETASAVAELLPPARFAAFAERHGLDLRALDELVAASYASGSLVVGRGVLDPKRVEAAFAKRTIVDERHVDGAIVHVSARSPQGPERLLVLGPVAAGVERGKAGPLKAAELFALGKLKRARPALGSPPLDAVGVLLGAFPARAFFPGPFDAEWARAGGGLLRAATAAAIGARPIAGPEPGGRLEVVLVVAGDFSDPEGAKARLGATLDRLFTSDFGRLLGTEQLADALRVDAIAATPRNAAGLRARVVLRAGPLFKGLYAATEASAEELFRAPQ